MARIEEASLPYDHLVGLSMLIYVQKDVESGQIIDSRCARIVEDMQLTEQCPSEPAWKSLPSTFLVPRSQGCQS